jgi:TPR repeat protein
MSDRNQIWRRLEREVAQGSTEALVMLGILYQWWKDYRRAFHHFERAAKLGDSAAPWILAAYCEKGRHGRPSPRRAFAWNCLAAENGDVDAILEAERLSREHRFALPPRRVIAWLRKAAERGDAEAFLWLGYHFSDGYGVRRDPHAAYVAWRRAADLGEAGAHYMLGWSFKYGEGVRHSWPRALGCYRAAARRGDDDALHEIADYFARVEKNPRKCVQWLRKAARRGHAESQCDLGIHLINGDGVRQDMAMAARLYRQSAEQGYGWAMQLLGRCYLEGDGVRRSLPAARRWLVRAVEAGKEEDCRETVRVARGLLAEMSRKRRKG